jgi:signal transduction histidine kinase
LIEGAIKVRVAALGEAATQLPWLSPGADALLALACSPDAAGWAEVRQDPGAVLLILRQSAQTLTSPCLSFFPAVLRDPAILEGARSFLNRSTPPGAPAGLLDWDYPATHSLYTASLNYAHLAQRLAQRTGRCDPDNAWVAGLLTPLGWLTVGAVAPEGAAACLADPELVHDATSVQQRHWGLDQAGIARRLLRRWRLPRWLSLVVGHLDLPCEIAQDLGAEPDLFRIVQLAVSLVQRQQPSLALPTGVGLTENAAALGLSPGELEPLAGEVASGLASQGQRTWRPPAAIPFLDDLLRLAIENLRLRNAPALEQLEAQEDQLHQALVKQQQDTVQQLQARKLSALAEFAAGAAHEINNPLAVISGQAQYLLGHEAEPAHQRALQTIIGQTQRIHQVLTELMQFARPPRPQPQEIELRSLLCDVTLSLGDFAAQRQVQLVNQDPDPSIHVQVDPRQIRTALECLVRNAIEAAPAGGWASVRLETPAADRLELIVEDSGSGPSAAQREHLFDPFYSGRLAGRGRGLGLPTAWRLAREQGGDVRFDALADGPTRFVLTLPRTVSANGLVLKNGTVENGRPAANGAAVSP